MLLYRRKRWLVFMLHLGPEWTWASVLSRTNKLLIRGCSLFLCQFLSRNNLPAVVKHESRRLSRLYLKFPFGSLEWFLAILRLLEEMLVFKFISMESIMLCFLHGNTFLKVFTYIYYPVVWCVSKHTCTDTQTHTHTRTQYSISRGKPSVLSNTRKKLNTLLTVLETSLCF